MSASSKTGSDRDVAAMEVEKPQIHWPSGLFTTIQVVITDLVLYSCLLPLLGTFLGGSLAYAFNLGHKYELLFVIVLTFIVIYGSFCLLGEPAYWKHLFAFDKFYCYLLQIRDGTNTLLLLTCIFGLASTIQSIADEDKMIKQPYVGEGAVYVFLKWFCDYFHIPESFLVQLGIMNPPSLSYRETQKFEHGAAYMLFWGILTGCLAKLIYFNTLFTYMRAMEIFISMKPSFDDDDEDQDSSMSMISTNNSHPSRLETDFAKYVKKPTWDN